MTESLQLYHKCEWVIIITNVNGLFLMSYFYLDLIHPWRRGRAEKNHDMDKTRIIIVAGLVHIVGGKKRLIHIVGAIIMSLA